MIIRNTDYLLENTIRTALKNFLNSNNRTFKANPHITRCMRRRSLVSHFRASFMKELYHYLGKEKLIDLKKQLSLFDSSIGWLDRLFGALMCVDSTGQPVFESYTGFDPNPAVIEGAHRLCKDLKPVYNPSFKLSTCRKGIETASISEILERNSGKYFDLAMTSPPFHKIPEFYNKGGENEDEQVWKRYKTTELYLRDFFIPFLMINYQLLTAGGIFILHFKEEDLLFEALKKINSTIFTNESMQIKTTGKYFPNLVTKGHPGENLFFFQRGNLNSTVPRLIKEKDENSNNSTYGI